MQAHNQAVQPIDQLSGMLTSSGIAGILMSWLGVPAVSSICSQIDLLLCFDAARPTIQMLPLECKCNKQCDGTIITVEADQDGSYHLSAVQLGEHDVNCAGARRPQAVQHMQGCCQGTARLPQTSRDNMMLFSINSGTAQAACICPPLWGAA